MARRIDPRYFNNLIDANVLDRTGGPDDAAVDRILELADAGEILVLLPHSVKSEIEHPNTPLEIRHRAAHLIFTEPVNLTPGELAEHARVRAILQGNAQPGAHDRDAYHIVESAKYGGYFITNDKRILSKAADASPQLAVVTPIEFLEAYDCSEAAFPRRRA